MCDYVLDMCGVDITDEKLELYNAMKAIALHKLTKEGLAAVLEQLASK